jgi:anti-sigma regulatory factor (Ser/Thr protein kinase)
MRVSRGFDHSPASVTAARRFVTETLRGVAADTIEVVELLVSELATNCVRHTAERFELTIVRGEREIRVEAVDFGGGEPAKRSPGPTEPNGRGLQIVDMLSTEWGCEPRATGGKTVWFRVALGAPAGAMCAHV